MDESRASNGKKPTLEEIIENYEREAEKRRNAQESARAERSVAFPENLFIELPARKTASENEPPFPTWTGIPQENASQNTAEQGEPTWRGTPARESFSDETAASEIETKIETKTKTETETGTGTEIKSEAKAQAEMQAGTEMEPKTVVSAETSRKPKEAEETEDRNRKKSKNTKENGTCVSDKKSRKKTAAPDSVHEPKSKNGGKTEKCEKREKNEKIEKIEKCEKIEKKSVRERNEELLASLRAEDIRGNDPEKQTGKALRAAIRNVLMAIFSLVLVGASLNLVRSLYDRRAADRFYTDLRERFYADGIDTTENSLGYLPKDGGSMSEARLYSDEGDIYEAPDLAAVDLHTLYERMLPNLESLKKVNSAIFGWIKVEGTRVDYPVVKSPIGNNDYYLTHALDKTYSDSGSIFMDYNNATDLSRNRNTCIYGHNMNDGTMFQTIMNFRTLSQFQNGTIEVYTADGIYLFTPFSVYDATPTESFFKVSFESDTEFADFITEIKGKSLFRSNVSVKSTDKVVTLITCTNTLVDKRFVVHGVLTETVK